MAAKNMAEFLKNRHIIHRQANKIRHILAAIFLSPKVYSFRMLEIITAVQD